MESWTVYKNSEKVLLWLYRNNKTIIELSECLGKTRQTVANNIKENTFSDLDLAKIRKIGCPI